MRRDNKGCKLHCSVGFQQTLLSTKTSYLKTESGYLNRIPKFSNFHPTSAFPYDTTSAHPITNQDLRSAQHVQAAPLPMSCNWERTPRKPTASAVPLV